MAEVHTPCFELLSSPVVDRPPYVEIKDASKCQVLKRRREQSSVDAPSCREASVSGVRKPLADR